MTVRTVPSWQLAGLSVTTVDGVRVVFVEPPDDDAGVREPSRPKPAPPTLTATASR